MPEAERYVGDGIVVESGSVLLGPDDDHFQIKIVDLIFSFHFVHDPTKPPVATEPTSRTGMRVTLNSWQTGQPTFKVKVGFLWSKQLYLAVHLQQIQNFRLLAYTFSTRGE